MAYISSSIMCLDAIGSGHSLAREYHTIRYTMFVIHYRPLPVSEQSRYYYTPSP